MGGSTIFSTKTPEVELYYPNLKEKDENYSHDVLVNFKIHLAVGNKNIEEHRKHNPLFMHEISYDETEEEIIKYMINRNGIDMYIFTDKDWTKYLIKGADAILKYVPRDKGRLDEDKTLNELESVNNLPINEIITGNKNLVSM